MVVSRVVAFQVCSSITLACAAPISAVNESISTIGLWSGEIAGSSCAQVGDLHRVGMLLEEQLAVDAGRRAHQRDRPLDEMRQDQLRDREVVVDDVELGDAGRRVDHPLGMADADALDLGVAARLLRRRTSPRSLRGAFFAAAFVVVAFAAVVFAAAFVSPRPPPPAAHG